MIECFRQSRGEPLSVIDIRKKWMARPDNPDPHVSPDKVYGRIHVQIRKLEINGLLKRVPHAVFGMRWALVDPPETLE